jgi:cytidine deaminase
MTDEKLIMLAQEAREKAYAPYSKFKVGAALLAKNNEVYTGCNIESVSFTPTVCAERTAFFKAITEGVTEFESIAIVGGLADQSMIKEFAYPCGVCRQVMVEFCNAETFHIIIAKSVDEPYEKYTLKELLPHGFSTKNLQNTKENE